MRDVKKYAALTLAAMTALSLTACGSSAATTTTTEAPAAEEAVEEVVVEEAAEEVAETVEVELQGTPNTQAVTVEGFDWGPVTTKTVVCLPEVVDPSTVDAADFTVTETKESFNWAGLGDESGETDLTQHIEVEAPRGVTAAYVSDADGNASTEPTNFVTLELTYNPNEGGVYCYDLFSGKNTICSPYNLTVALADGAEVLNVNGEAIAALAVDPAADIAGATVPQIEGFDLDQSFTATDGTNLTYASYTPANASEDSKKALVIWVHGAGEGGTDTTIPLLGNEVTSLVSDEFQSTFDGAYVLVPQCEQFWLCYDAEDFSKWADNPGTDSIYTTALMELIENFVAENPGVDANRVIIGGCSNGGYMTMNMIINYPDYFAAAYPICEAYADAGMTDEKVAAIKDLPIWFIYAANDTTVDPTLFEQPTIAKLQAAGAANIHVSEFEDVHDTNGYTDAEGNAYQYSGHWSWTYFFNNQVEDNGENMWAWLAAQSK